MRRPFVVVAGLPGVGKSRVCAVLSDLLDVPTFGPDDFSGRWSSVYDRLDSRRSAVVECCRLPGALCAKKRVRGAFVVVLTASEIVRHERLRMRGETNERLFAASSRPISYESTVTPDLVLDTDGATPEAIADQIFSELAVLGHW